MLATILTLSPFICYHLPLPTEKIHWANPISWETHYIFIVVFHCGAVQPYLGTRDTLWSVHQVTWFQWGTVCMPSPWVGTWETMVRVISWILLSPGEQYDLGFHGTVLPCGARASKGHVWAPRQQEAGKKANPDLVLKTDFQKDATSRQIWVLWAER